MISATIRWFLTGEGTTCFDLSIDSSRVLTTPHPLTIAAALHIAGVEIVEFANVEVPSRPAQTVLMPFEQEDLAEITSVAGSNPPAVALLAALHATYVQIEFAYTYGAEVLPQVTLHWHLANSLIEQCLRRNVPLSPPPANFGEFLMERIPYIYYPKVSAN